VCLCAVCKLNVHKRCAKNVANNCGINTKDMAKVLQELGISGDKFSTASKRKKAGRFYAAVCVNVVLAAGCSCKATHDSR